MASIFAQPGVPRLEQLKALLLPFFSQNVDGPHDWLDLQGPSELSDTVLSWLMEAPREAVELNIMCIYACMHACMHVCMYVCVNPIKYFLFFLDALGGHENLPAAAQPLPGDLAERAAARGQVARGGPHAGRAPSVGGRGHARGHDGSATDPGWDMTRVDKRKLTVGHRKVF